MERRERLGKRVHLEVEGNGDMCGVGITELPPNTVRRRHQQRWKSRDEPNLEEVKEMVVGAGSKIDGMVQTAVEGKKLAGHQQKWKCRDKPKLDEVKEIVVGNGSKDDGMVQPAVEGKKLAGHQQKWQSRNEHKPVEAKVIVVGAGSKEDGNVQPAGEGKKLETLTLSKELMEYIRTREVMGILATETPRPSLERIPQELFGSKLQEQIAAEYEENREFDAYVLFQYRTKGYAQIRYLANDEEM